jgi:hypothetical protein
MNRILWVALVAVGLTACSVTTETAVHSFNGKTVEIELYGDTFAYGNDAQKEAQLAAAKAQAESVCDGPAQYLSRRLEHKPQNGIYYVPASNLALFKCL